MSSSRRYAVPRHVVSELLEGGTVLLNLDSGVYFTLNATGTRMWQLLGEEADLDAICGALQDEFDVAPDTLADDLDGLVEQLLAKGLLEARPAPR